MAYKTEFFTKEHSNGLIALSDKVIGKNFIQKKDLIEFFEEPRSINKQCSLILLNHKNEILGARITFAPLNWTPSIIKKSLSPQLFPQAGLAYFKTLIVDPSLQGLGWGPKLTKMSINYLKTLGATSAICHCWKESPENSAAKYLLKLGFNPIGEIKNFWQDIDYDCVVCMPKKCNCTAIEMKKEL